MPRKKHNDIGISEFEIQSLAKVLLPAMRAYLESEEGQREFAAWQAEREQKQLNTKLKRQEESR